MEKIIVNNVGGIVQTEAQKSLDMYMECHYKSALTEGVYFILLSMLKPRHGYLVMQYVGKLTKGRVVLGPGTLYGAINTLLEKQWIRAVGEDKDSRKKEYIITNLGRKILVGEMERLFFCDRIHKLCSQAQKFAEETAFRYTTSKYNAVCGLKCLKLNCGKWI